MSATLQVARKLLPRSKKSAGSEGYIAPRSQLEQAVHEAWVHTLHLTEPVSIHSNFFEVSAWITCSTSTAHAT